MQIHKSARIDDETAMKQPTKKKSLPSSSHVDADEIERFQSLAAEWWDPNGPMAPLHGMNPTRLEWLIGQLNKHFKSLNKKTILDVGCGGGLTAEPLARLGATVTGIDGASDLIAVAAQHAKEQDLNIHYRCALTNDLIAEKKTYDAVIALEVIEHVPDQALFVQELAQLVRPGGLVLFSTLNRTPASFAFGVVAAEYILKWLPAGTHTWKKFVKPSELYDYCLQAKLTPLETCGMVYKPLTKSFALDESNLSINYFLAAIKP